MMDAVDIAWFAGFFEGEGSIGFNRPNGYGPYPYLQLSSTDEDMVLRVRDVTGCGIVELVGKTSALSKKPLWRWRVNSRRDVSRLLLAVYPLMGKRRQARIADAAVAFTDNQRRVRKSRSKKPAEVPAQGA